MTPDVPPCTEARPGPDLQIAILRCRITGSASECASSREGRGVAKCHGAVGLRHAVLVQLPIQRLTIEAQDVGSARLVAAHLSQDLEDVFALQITQRRLAP